jgi:hypothetical protein
MFNVYQIEDQEILQASFQSYNDWTADYCKEAPERLFPLVPAALRPRRRDR